MTKKTKKPMEDIRVNGSLKTFLRWPAFFAGIWIVATILAIYLPSAYQVILVIAAVLTVALALFLNLYYHKKLNKAMVSFASEYCALQQELLGDMAVPFAIIDRRGDILWANEQYKSITDDKARFFESFTGSKRDVLNGAEDRYEFHLEHEGKKYQADIRRVALSPETALKLFDDGNIPNGGLYAAYLADESEMLEIKQTLWERELMVALIYVDNMDEAMESVEEVRSSMLAALIERKINNYVIAHGGLTKKTERDKYFVIFPQKYLPKMLEGRFSLLEDVKTVNIGNTMSVTLSIGVGMTGDTFSQRFDAARAAVEMALGRGGDQAVVKMNEKMDFYGGKSQSKETNTRVKARVKAHAMRELIMSREKVIIMGHQKSDMDALGAAIGVYRAAKTSGRKAYIVLDQVIPAIKPALERIKESAEYDEDLFIQTPKAKELMDDHTVLVVVDVNNPFFAESPDLLKKSKCTIVLDHHRQTKDVITNAVMSYIEPYASSTCEMVAEILQYYADDVKIKAIDADTMYAGILIDTTGFTAKTGVRTFEAAAFLRRCGADMIKVRKMSRDDVDDYRIRMETVSKAVMFRGHFAISKCLGTPTEDITVISAQAANELLNIRGVKASFVLSESEGAARISARSIDEVNVQIIMEQMGGGGHMNASATQLNDTTMDEAIEQLKELLTRMEENGEI